SGTEHRAPLVDLHLVPGTPVVEPGRDLDVERHLPSDAAQHTDDLVPGGGHAAGKGRHEVHDLSHALVGQEPGHENGGVREVQLLAGDRVRRRMNGAVTASTVVQQ